MMKIHQIMVTPVQLATLVCIAHRAHLSQTLFFTTIFLMLCFSSSFYLVAAGFPFWARGCVFAQDPSGPSPPIHGCFKVANDTEQMEVHGCTCQENGCNKELKEPSGKIQIN